MIKLNIEYTYKELCVELDLSYQPANNNTKKKQIKCIEDSYEFYHPINPKTKKPKKSYIFTKQIKEFILEDGRKNNGGFRENSGRKSLIPEEEFDYLWKVMVSEAYKKNKYIERSWLNKVYFSNTLLFEMFGFSYSHYLKKAKFEEDDDVVKNVFQNIVYEALKANTITRLCKRYGFNKNSLPKGILRSKNSVKLGQMIDDDELLDEYNEIEAKILKEMNCYSIIDAVRQGKYKRLMDGIQSEFSSKKKYNVQKFNVIKVEDFSVIENGENFGDKKLIEEYRNHFRQVILSSVEKSCLNRIKNNQKYKLKLNEKQKELLKKYLYNMLSESEPVCIKTLEHNDSFSISKHSDKHYEDYEWLKLIV